MGLGIPTLTIKSVLESNSPKSTMLVGRLRLIIILLLIIMIIIIITITMIIMITITVIRRTLIVV